LSGRAAARIGDTPQNIPEPLPGIDLVEAAGCEERIEDGGSCCTFVGACEVVVFAPDSDLLHLALDGVVVEVGYSRLKDS